VNLKSASEVIGTTLASGITTFASARAQCGAAAACVGLTWDKADGSKWRLFGGERREGATGKYRTVGEAIDPWMPAP
jgi:hypothetical protein